jgi:hypothetical protein
LTHTVRAATSRTIVETTISTHTAIFRRRVIGVAPFSCPAPPASGAVEVVCSGVLTAPSCPGTENVTPMK